MLFTSTSTASTTPPRLRGIVLGSSRAIGYSSEPYSNGLVQQPQNSWWTYFCWAGPLLNVRNAGVRGDTVVQMQARLQADVLAYAPDVVFLECGGANDIPTSATPADFALALTTLQAMSATMRAAGIDVIHTLEPGRPFMALGDDYHARNVVAWLKAAGLTLLDFRPVLMDSQAGTYNRAWSDDGVHVNLTGAKVQAQYALDWWEAHRPSYERPPLTTSDTDTSNLLTYGTFSGASNSGATPQGWTLVNVSAVGITAAIVDPIDTTTDPKVAGKLWKATVVAGTATGTLAIRQDVTLPVPVWWAPGDTILQGFWVKAEGFEATGVQYSIGVLYDGATNQHRPMNAWSQDFEGWVWVEGTVIPAGATNVKFFVTIDGLGGVLQQDAHLWVGMVTLFNATAQIGTRGGIL